MSLPNFLTVNSPPRSPHVARTGYFDSVMPQVGARGGSVVFRPTRRDLLLCLLTLSFSYLLFSPASSSEPVSGPLSSTAAGGSKYKIPWSSIFKATESCPPAPPSVGTTYTESVQSYGITGVEGIIRVEEGEEEQEEDDEVVKGETILKGHHPGWTMFDNLYLHNGSFYIVTHDQKDFPELRYMTSTGLPAIPGNGEEREPKGHEILFISPGDAAKLWGPRVYRMEGMSWLWNDGQFIDHYYHFAAELLLGTWRTYASMDQDITAQGHTSLPPPRRIWFMHHDVNQWRDVPRFNPTILFNAFPSVSLLYPEDYADIALATGSHLPSAYVMDRALLADRSAAFRSLPVGSTARTVAGAIRVGTTSRWWWEPIRRQILRYSGVDEAIINRNLEGFGAVDPVDTMLTAIGTHDLEPLAPQGDYVPVVTYISRQNSRRRMTAESHKKLVEALTDRSKKVGFELVIVEAEKLTKEEQFALAGRTTIMLGVHGNGLTHLLWMPATPRSTVIEMYIKDGFAPDYQWTAHALGIRHYGVAYDTVFTSPNLPEILYPEGFQGTSIEIDAKVVADLVVDRLAGKLD